MEVTTTKSQQTFLPVTTVEETLCSHRKLRWFSDADGSIVYHKGSRKTYSLNAEATMLLLLCDGSRNAKDIAVTALGIQDVRAVSKNTTEHNYLCWLEWARNEGLISIDSSSADSPKIIKPKKLGKFAELLLESGEYPAAHRCAVALTKLAPEEADSWYTLGDAEYAMEDYDAARQAYEKSLSIEPDSTLAHLVVALSRGNPPEKASSEYIAQTFDNYADSFDHELLVDLEYKAPETIKAALEDLLPLPSEQLNVLDLGCGTGLMGKEIAPWARSITGVDLSTKMLSKAMLTGDYREVHAAEIVEFLNQDTTLFDLILAADVLLYFGDLSAVMHLSRRRIARNGIFSFTVEKGDHKNYDLTVSGRYSHGANYIKTVAVESGYELLSMEETILRTEYAKKVIGYLVILKPVSN